MLTVAAVRSPVAHNDTIAERDTVGRGIEVLTFEGHYWLVSGITHPPDEIWDRAQPGDTIRLHGNGNRWGVFYDEIELIKQEQ